MNEQYIEEFLREGEEQITTLNNSLLELETDPNDEAAMEEIFRTAHTLKGNFAAMGFDDASNLAHAVEDLLDAIREGEVAVTPEIMDRIFAGVDQIEAAMDQIEAEGEPQIDPSKTIDQLRAAIEGDTGEQTTSTETTTVDGAFETAGIDPDEIEEELVVLELTVEPGELKGVDAMIVLEELDEELTVRQTDPDRSIIEDGQYDDHFAVLVETPDIETAERIGNDPGPVVDVTATPITDQLETADTSESTPESKETVVDEIETVRIDVEQLDRLYRLVEQFVTGHVRLERATEQTDIESIQENVDELGKTTQTLQDTVIDMRLVPFDTIIGKFPRMVRDLAREQDKRIQFAIEGRDVEIDRSILTELGDPLSHILRNAIDHGIEPPAEREAQGKPPEGTIELRARRQRDGVIVEVADDGRGLDIEGIRETALEEGIRTPEELEQMTDSELYDLVFHPGFSTTDEVTEVSGRGVGMDVVNETITQLDGSINVESTPGEGTTVSLHLPVTMAIEQVLILQVGAEEYGIPIKHVEEITTRSDAVTVDGSPVLEYEDDLYPVIELAERFAVPDADTEGAGNLIRIDPEERRIAIGCDQVRAQQTVVIKPLEGMLGGTPGLSGTAILGDGDIMYLLDIPTL